MPFATVLVDAEFQVAGEAGSGPGGIQICRQTDPDVVLMDIGLPGMSGIETTAELSRHCPRSRVLMLSMYDDEESVMAAVRAGARGFVLKKACATELVDAMRTVARGGTYFGSQVSARLLSGVQGGKSRAPGRAAREPLSRREQQVLRLTVEGKSNKEAAALFEPGSPHRAQLSQDHDGQTGGGQCRGIDPGDRAVGIDRPHRE